MQSGLKSLSGMSGVSGFTPDDVSGLQLWLDANVGVYEDANKQDSAENSDSVYTWAARVGPDAVQSSSSERPTYDTSAVNTRPGITFDASDDLFTLDSSISLSAVTYAAVVKVPDNDGSHPIAQPEAVQFPSTTHLPYAYTAQATDNKWNVTDDDALSVQSTADISLGNATLLLVTCSSTEVVIRIDGSADSTHSEETVNFSNPLERIGGAGGNGLTIAELLVYDSVLWSSAITQLETYLKNKWGIS